MKKRTLSNIIIIVLVLLLGAAVIALVVANSGKDITIPGISFGDDTLSFASDARVVPDGITEVKFTSGRKTLAPDDYTVKIVPTQDDFYISQSDDTLLPSSALDADLVNACFSITKNQGSFVVSGPETCGAFVDMYFGYGNAEVVEFSANIKPFKVVLSAGDKIAELAFTLSDIVGISLDKENLEF